MNIIYCNSFSLLYLLYLLVSLHITRPLVQTTQQIFSNLHIYRDDEMDGEWEAPLINNPKCADAPGCGEWKAPVIDNPNYKGKWRPPMIDNPNYRGKWTPRKIPNPDYYEDLEPFKMTTIVRTFLLPFC